MKNEIEYLAHMLDESFPEKHAYLCNICPPRHEHDMVNGVILYDDNGKRVDKQFNFQYNCNCGKSGYVGLPGWCAVEGEKVTALTDFDSGHGPKDISIPQLAHFLEDHGYKLVDER